MYTACFGLRNDQPSRTLVQNFTKFCVKFCMDIPLDDICIDRNMQHM